ncbi:hypothetical protein ACIRCZ_19600 [Leifsonia sp. NPDC102414]|uniref:hypothetical protein n=1 Tax=Leifsonia sp. NPDC102414 TaxID=3364124 RepID=UPI003807CB68
MIGSRTSLSIVLAAITAVAAATPAAAAPASFDPVQIVQQRALLGTAADAPPAGHGPSSIRPLAVDPIDVGTSALPAQASTSAAVAPNGSYGYVTGITKFGTNASYAVLANSSAPSSYRFAIGAAGDDLTLSAEHDGSILVHDSAGKLVNIILPAWAIDADGRPLPTIYTINGTTLTQHIDTAGARFPVVADPSYGCGVGWCSLYFNKSETRDIATSGFTALGGAAAACAIGGAVAVAACALAAASIGATAQYAQNHKQCVGLSFWGVPPLVGWNPFTYTGPQCR